MTNKLIAKPKQSKKELAKNRASELKEKYIVEFSNDGSSYRLVDKTTGQVATETDAGVAYGDRSTRNRTNRLIGREMAKDNGFSSFIFGDEPVRRRSSTTQPYNPAGIKIQDTPIELPKDITIDAPTVEYTPSTAVPIDALPTNKPVKSDTERFKTVLAEIENDLNSKGYDFNRRTEILNTLINNPKLAIEYSQGKRQPLDLLWLVGKSKPTTNKPVNSTTATKRLSISTNSIKDVLSNKKDGLVDIKLVNKPSNGERVSIGINKYNKVELDKGQPLFDFKWK